MNLLLFTGASGAGVSTNAAAAAVAAARRGERVLLLSQEPAPVLTAMFAQPVPESSFRVPLTGGGLWCRAADPERETAATWRSLTPWLADAAASLGSDAPEPSLLTMLPDSRLLALFLALSDIRTSASFDTVVLDAGPVLALARWLLLLDAASRLDFSAGAGESLAVRVGRPLLRRITGVPLPDEASRRELSKLTAALTEGAALLAGETATCIAAARPGRLGILALRPELSLLALAGVCPDTVAVQLHHQAQAGTAEDGWFAPLSSCPIPRLSAEPVGVAQLAALAETAPILHHRRRRTTPGHHLITRAGGLELWLPLPYVAPADLRLLQDGDRLTVIIPGGRRTLALPDALHDKPCTGARLEDGRLCLSFPAETPV